VRLERVGERVPVRSCCRRAGTKGRSRPSAPSPRRS
jgi:hypothetical protein